jgi:hypothetical protein
LTHECLAPLLELRKRDLALELVAQVAGGSARSADPLAEHVRDLGESFGAEHE